MNYHPQIRVRTHTRVTPNNRKQTAGRRNTPVQWQNIPVLTRKQGGSARSENEPHLKPHARRRKRIGPSLRSSDEARKNYARSPRIPKPQPKTSARRRKKPSRC